MAEVMKNSAVLKRVQEEVRAVAGNKERVQLDDIMPKLKYLKMVVKETLRLHPTALLLAPRETGRIFELLPFGAGRRTCPGMAMGVATVAFTLANLLYCFDWELLDGGGHQHGRDSRTHCPEEDTPLVLVPTRYKCQP
ncbi:LOW QUALITY PROTEIN: hypothetical protein SETIT_9G010400v2 [Setaria italica]|uniref:Cytochrome P450 n=1 Tax=Setaria italica TaxID=4555 RepID=A0A368SC37_SETIT|nr:LOW QUALITY PROTEIN: hypothetical protein SETIT_9G010400v2 [Setaria italica]